MTTAQSWDRGYPVAEPYPPAWHPFQSPAHLAAICAVAGVAWDAGPATPLRIAEVACGTGLTACLLAAGNPHWEVVGLDYNPAHIAEGRAIAAAAGLSNIRFLEADLAELDGAALDALPEFDLVTAHGLWSWVADPVREGLLRLLRRRLAPGGLAMVSYNAMPGAAGGLGLARLVRGQLLAAGGTTAGLEAARDLARRLIAAEAAHLPPSGWRAALLGEGESEAREGYLLHEFLTEHWRPAFFGDVASAMASARCDFVGSATISENFPGLTLSPPQQAIRAAAPDEASRQLVQDLCVPRAFRRDLFVRGLRRVPREAASSAIRLTAGTHARGDVKLATQAGEATLPRHLLDPIRAALAEGPRRIAELRALPGCAALTPEEMAGWLLASGVALPAWALPGEAPRWEDGLRAARRLNQVLAARLAPFGVGAGQFGLASPVLGGALAVPTLELAVVARLATLPDGAAPAEVARLLPPPGVAPPPEAMAGLEAAIATLMAERGPVWRATGLV